MFGKCLLLLVGSNICACQSPELIIDMTHDIDGFLEQNNSQHTDNIERALNYSLNVQYTTWTEKVEDILTNVSTVLRSVCARSEIMSCSLDRIGLYINYQESWSKLLYGGTNGSEGDTLSFIRRNRHEFRVCVLSFGAKNNKDFDNLDGSLAQLAVIKSPGFEFGYNLNKANYNPIFRSSQHSFNFFSNFFFFHTVGFPNGIPESSLLFENKFAETILVFSTIKKVYPEDRRANFHVAIDLTFEESTSEVSNKIISDYTKLFLRFVNTLMKENEVSAVLSGVAIPDNCTRLDVATATVVGENVFPVAVMPAQHIHLAPVLAFQTVLVSGLDWINQIKLNIQNDKKSNDSSGQQKLTNVLVDSDDGVDVSDEDIEELCAFNQSLPKAIGVQVTSLLFSPPEFQTLTKDSQVSNLLQDCGLQFGIKINLGHLDRYESYDFSQIPSPGLPAKVVMFQFYINFHDLVAYQHSLGLYSWYTKRFRPNLISFHKDWSKYAESHPNTQVIIHLMESKPAYALVATCYGRAYCNDCFKLVDTIYEGLVMWAKFHGVTLVVKQAVATHEELLISGTAWYEYLLGVPTEVLVSRCNPMRVRNWQRDCIHQTTSVPRKGIPFHSKVGITVNGRLNNAQNKSLAPDELRLMTAFAFSKFELVEILLEQDAECNIASTVEKALEPLKAHTFRNGSQTQLFLQFPLNPVEKMPLATQLNCYENVTKTVSNILNVHIRLAGVHLRMSDFADFQTMKKFRIDTKSARVKLGIFVSNCFHFLFVAPSRCTAPLYQVDYIVCGIASTETSNSNMRTMSLLLDQVFYVKEKLCPQLQVYFRLTSGSKGETIGISHSTPSDFIKFIGDWARFSDRFNLPIFLTETVDHLDGGTLGWWRVSNWTDLANPQVYFEKQAEVLKEATWRPPFLELPGPEIPERENPAPTDIVGISLTTAIVAVTIVTVVGVAAFKFWLRKRRLLTEEEVRAILEGDHTHFSTEMMVLSEQEDNAIYDQAYEISKSKFNFDEEIPLGSGNFGDVVKAQLGDDFVAVKKPNESCTRQGLMSMLEEVRILSRVGTHEQVLRFIGASTKHASTGVIYIATELCENGCLEKFLKNLAPSMENDDINDMTLNLHQLNQFAFEIASGMEYISSKRIIHRDLATRNVLLDSHMTCKIGDFGLSRKLYDDGLYEKRGKDPMPWRWLAVESLQRQEYSSASDVWSYGVTVWEIFSFAKLPYFEITAAAGFGDLVQNGLRLNNPPILPQSTFKTVSECWNSESGQRPSFTHLKEFFREILSQVYSDNADI